MKHHSQSAKTPVCEILLYGALTQDNTLFLPAFLVTPLCLHHNVTHKKVRCCART
ncbi:glutamate synthase [Acetobacter orientalis]|uniref:Glutamate synthase n=1 Tax=Acetobacter orientalis TaxID=146474 RepID=A0A2Z5ZJE4_9PROT|nr:glutamate synthase [Acetobacter orientalis]